MRLPTLRGAQGSPLSPGKERSSAWWGRLPAPETEGSRPALLTSVPCLQGLVASWFVARLEEDTVTISCALWNLLGGTGEEPVPCHGPAPLPGPVLQKGSRAASMARSGQVTDRGGAGGSAPD